MSEVLEDASSLNVNSDMSTVADRTLTPGRLSRNCSCVVSLSAISRHTSVDAADACSAINTCTSSAASDADVKVAMRT